MSQRSTSAAPAANPEDPAPARTPDDLNRHARLGAADLEVLQGALGLRPPVHVVCHLNLAHGVRLRSGARLPSTRTRSCAHGPQGHLRSGSHRNSAHSGGLPGRCNPPGNSGRCSGQDTADHPQDSRGAGIMQGQRRPAGGEICADGESVIDQCHVCRSARKTLPFLPKTAAFVSSEESTSRAVLRGRGTGAVGRRLEVPALFTGWTSGVGVGPPTWFCSSLHRRTPCWDRASAALPP